MPMIFIRHVGANLAYVEPIGAVDPGFGVGGGGVDPDYGHPIFGHPGNRPPGSYPGRPDNTLPGSPGTPGNELPGHPPPQVAPGQVVVMVRDATGKWKYAAWTPGSAPPKPLPEPTPPVVDNTLPPAPAPKA